MKRFLMLAAMLGLLVFTQGSTPSQVSDAPETAVSACPSDCDPSDCDATSCPLPCDGPTDCAGAASCAVSK